MVACIRYGAGEIGNAMSEVTLRAVSKQLGATKAIDDVSVEARDRQFLVLLGPSGSGKTTLLRLVAGFLKPDRGDVVIGGVKVNDIPGKDRNVSMVFQDYALYPHLSAFDNVAFPLKVQGVTRKERGQRVSSVADTLDIGHLLHRKPRELSGGQRQRVALARAIVRSPQVYLMDEPLAALDTQIRVRVRSELKALHAKLKTTTIYVTHDQEEAMTLGDAIAILHQGVLQQIGTPLEIYDRPANEFVARFIGNPPINLLAGRIDRVDGSYILATEDESYDLQGGGYEGLVGQQVVAGVRPEHVAIGTGPGEEGKTHNRGKVMLVEPLGPETIVTIESGQQWLRVRAGHACPVQAGEHITFHIDGAKLSAFSPTTGENLGPRTG